MEKRTAQNREACMGRRRNRLVMFLLGALVLPALAVTTPTLSAQQQKPSDENAGPAPKHDLTGVWQSTGRPGAESMAPSAEKDMPPMTPWAQAKFNTERPGYGTRAVPDGNDPILQCDPAGFPRIMFSPTQFEFLQVN